MTIYESWKRNVPDTVSGESLTVTITYRSFNKSEIDAIEAKMPKGMIFMYTDKPQRMYPREDVNRE